MYSDLVPIPFHFSLLQGKGRGTGNGNGKGTGERKDPRTESGGVISLRGFTFIISRRLGGVGPDGKSCSVLVSCVRVVSCVPCSLRPPPPTSSLDPGGGRIGKDGSKGL